MKTINIGHNDWLTVQFKLNDENSIFSINSNLNCHLNTLTFNEAADHAAKLIAEKYDNIHIAMSGGLDSEFVAKVFLRNNLKFTPVLLLNATNKQESWYAFKFCKENNIKLKVLNFENFYDHNKLLKRIIVKSIKLNVPPNVSLIPNIIFDYIKAPIVTGYGDCYNISSVNDINEPYSKIKKSNYVEISEHDFYIALENYVHPGPFFCYTPELLQQSLLEIDINNSLQIIKSNLYELMPRPKIVTSLHDITISDTIRNFFINKTKKNVTYIHYEKEKFLDLINNLENNKLCQ